MDVHVFGVATLTSQKFSFPFSAPENSNTNKVTKADESSPSSKSKMYKFANHFNQTETPDSEEGSQDSIEQDSQDTEANGSLEYHMSLLCSESQQEEQGELATTPIFTTPILEHAEDLVAKGRQEAFTQYGLLAGLTERLPAELGVKQIGERVEKISQDPRVFFNIAAPSSTFICGSQGSGKSHTLFCLLESCLISSKANKLPKPLTGLVFHYDTFISDHGGAPCEAAYLASDPAIKVRVLCSPTNYWTVKRIYESLNVTVEPLILREVDLNTKRMLDLMAVSREDGPMPLYLHSIYRILRNMRITQQENNGKFSYKEFKRQVMGTTMTPAQIGPLNQRLDTLESFMSKTKTGNGGNNWTPQPGSLTIVDLSCPCVTAEGACALFNICLSIFLEQDIKTGRVIALDEAHKFMNASAEANTLTNTLLTTIRLQRHLGARIIISTQEPTISPTLLDLSSITIVHRFTSPEWLRTLGKHLAAAASDLVQSDPESKKTEDTGANHAGNDKQSNDNTRKIFGDVVKLRAGEALLFSPSAMVGLEKCPTGEMRMTRLGAAYLKVRVRKRLTTDGGKSVMAS